MIPDFKRSKNSWKKNPFQPHWAQELVAALAVCETARGFQPRERCPASLLVEAWRGFSLFPSFPCIFVPLGAQHSWQSVVRRSLETPSYFCSIFHTILRIMSPCELHTTIFDVTEFRLMAEILTLQIFHNTLKILNSLECVLQNSISLLVALDYLYSQAFLAL